MKETILIIDDDARIRNLTSEYLTNNGYDVLTAENPRKVSKQNLVISDLLLLDIMMPEMDGLTYLKTIKSSDPQKLVLLVTAKSDTSDKINGLSIGADDYITKPFEPEELLYRIKNLLKRAVKIVKLGNINLDTTRMTLSNELGQEINFSSTEILLLNILLQHLNNIVSRQEIINLLPAIISERSIDVQINRIRKKIELDPKNPKYIKTIRHTGYIFTY